MLLCKLHAIFWWRLFKKNMHTIYCMKFSVLARQHLLFFLVSFHKDLCPSSSLSQESLDAVRYKLAPLIFQKSLNVPVSQTCSLVPVSGIYSGASFCLENFSHRSLQNCWLFNILVQCKRETSVVQAVHSHSLPLILFHGMSFYLMLACVPVSIFTFVLAYGFTVCFTH